MKQFKKDSGDESQLHDHQELGGIKVRIAEELKSWRVGGDRSEWPALFASSIYKRRPGPRGVEVRFFGPRD